MAKNEITAFFKGRTGVAEPLYQYDVGQVLVIDGIEDLPTPFEAEYEMSGAEETIPAVGQDYRVAIPDRVLSLPGIVTVYIPVHNGETDAEVEYVVRFNVINRARPVDDGTSEDQTAISQAIALLQTRSERISTEIVEAVADQLPGVLDSMAEEYAAYARHVATVIASAVAGHYNVNNKVNPAHFLAYDGKLRVLKPAFIPESSDAYSIYLNGVKLSGNDFYYSDFAPIPGQTGEYMIFNLTNFTTNAEIEALLDENEVEVVVLKVGGEQ